MYEETSLVFVLMPGQKILLGAQAHSPSQDNFRPAARAHEGPVREESVPPCYLSKFELTQAQWLRLSGDEPSIFRAGVSYPDFGFGPDEFNSQHPVESVSWTEVMDCFRRWGLQLPSEPQWELACRSGGYSLAGTGPDSDLGEGFANVMDQALSAIYEYQGRAESFDDGFPVHAPVGSLSANGWGFHDMIGNVMEWCTREPESAQLLGLRGGHFGLMLDYCNATTRDMQVLDFRSHLAGVRPKLDLELR